jgi:hypothetical protein
VSKQYAVQHWVLCVNRSSDRYRPLEQRDYRFSALCEGTSLWHSMQTVPLKHRMIWTGAGRATKETNKWRSKATHRTCRGIWRWPPDWQHTLRASARTGPCSRFRRSRTQAVSQRGPRRPDTAWDTHRWHCDRRSRRHTAPRMDTSYHGTDPPSLRGRCSNMRSVHLAIRQERPHASFRPSLFRFMKETHLETSPPFWLHVHHRTH